MKKKTREQASKRERRIQDKKHRGESIIRCGYCQGVDGSHAKDCKLILHLANGN